MNDLFNLFQSMSALLESCEFSNILINDPASYNMSKKSLFLDIGSGFGKPVFHAAFQVGCESLGIEVVPARVEFCIDFYYEYIAKGDFFKEVNKTLASNDDQSDSDDNVNHSNCFNCLCSVNINLNDLNGNIFQQVFEKNRIIDYHLNKNIIYEDVFYNFFHKTKQSSLLISEIEIQWDNFFTNSLISISLEERLNKDLEKGFLKHIFNFLNINLQAEKHQKKKGKKVSKNAEINHISYHDFCNFINDIYNFNNFIIFDFIIFTNVLFNSFNVDDSTLINQILMISKTNEGLEKVSLTLNFDENNNTEIKSVTSKTSKKAFKTKTIQEKENNYGRPKAKILKGNKTNNLTNNEDGNQSDNDDCLEDKVSDFEIVNHQSSLLKTALKNKKFAYNSNWYEKVKFISNDATKYKVYCNDNKEVYTHIYSYNKLMSKECRSRIAKVLNKTNYKVLAWYSNPKQTVKSGLKNFKFICKFPMQSTSTEKFHCYVYVKVKDKAKNKIFI